MNQNHKGSLTEDEIKGIEEWAWVPFNGWEGLNYKKYASDILNYRPLFGKELNSTKILILIKLWENKTRENTTFHTLEVLGRAAGINSTYASVMITEMCQSNLACKICGQEFGILEVIGSYKYETDKEGNLYRLTKIERLLMHITNIHQKPDPQTFYEYLKQIEKEPKSRNSEKQIENLIWKKKNEF